MILPKLDTKHWMWIFEIAAEHFAGKVAELEVEMMRHLQFSEAPIATANNVRNTDRKKRLIEIGETMDLYKDILIVLRAQREGLQEMSANDAARVYLGYLKAEQREIQKAKATTI